MIAEALISPYNEIQSRSVLIHIGAPETVAMILCIDDEPVGLRVRKLMLEHAGYKVLTASGGSEGLSIFSKESINAVVLDYAMPEMNGGEVAAEMKRQKPDVPILMLSAYVDLPEDALQFVDAQALKGESPLTFLSELKKLLSVS